MFKPTVIFLLTPTAVLLLWIIFVTCVSCLSGILSCLFLADAGKGLSLALLNVTFSCVFVTFPDGVLGQVWYLIVSIPDFSFFLIFFFLFYTYYIN